MGSSYADATGNYTQNGQYSNHLNHFNTANWKYPVAPSWGAGWATVGIQPSIQGQRADNLPLTNGGILEYVNVPKRSVDGVTQITKSMIDDLKRNCDGIKSNMETPTFPFPSSPQVGDKIDDAIFNGMIQAIQNLYHNNLLDASLQTNTVVSPNKILATEVEQLANKIERAARYANYSNYANSGYARYSNSYTDQTGYSVYSNHSNSYANTYSNHTNSYSNSYANHTNSYANSYSNHTNSYSQSSHNDQYDNCYWQGGGYWNACACGYSRHTDSGYGQNSYSKGGYSVHNNYSQSGYAVYNQYIVSGYSAYNQYTQSGYSVYSNLSGNGDAGYLNYSVAYSNYSNSYTNTYSKITGL